MFNPNSGIRNLSAYNMFSPITGENMVWETKQYDLADGNTLLLHMVFPDSLGDVNDANGNFITRSSLNNDKITFPLVNIKPDDWCGRGGLGFVTPQPSICALQGYGGLDSARSVLPIELQDMIAKYDIEEQPDGHPTENYPVGPEIYRLQELPLPQNSFFQLHG